MLSLLTATLVVAAIRSDGYHASKVEMDDASVWVFDTRASVIARVNGQTREFDAAVSLGGDLSDTELWQRGETVTLGFYDGTKALFPEQVKVVDQSNDQVGADTVRDADGGVSVIVKDGSAWVGQDSALASFSAEGGPSDGADSRQVISDQLSSMAKAAVSPGGAAVVVDPALGKYFVVGLDDDLQPTDPESHPIDLDLNGPAGYNLTVVGDRPVVSYQVVDGYALAWPGLDQPVVIVASELALQQPGPRASSVIVATNDALLRVPFDGSQPTELAEGSGHPAAPVLLGGCVHAAWALSAEYVQVCGEGEPVRRSLGDDVGDSERLVFRVNKRVIALNGDNGHVFLIVGDELTPVTNWDEVLAEEENEQPPQRPDPELAKCETADNARPQTQPDTYGVHPGETVRMNVLDNDSDANCDALTVIMPDWSPDLDGTLAVIDHGQSFQYHAPFGMGNRRLDVTYKVSDGAGASRESKLTIEVITGHDRQPTDLRPSETIVEAGKSVEYNVLVDMIDHDGDALTVTGVDSGGRGDVQFNSNGTVRFDALGVAPGAVTVNVQVTDSFTAPISQPLLIDVRPAGTPLRPTARNDYVTGKVGETAVVEPLANDTDPNNDQLILTQLFVADADKQFLSVSQGERGELYLHAEQPRPEGYRITYLAEDGSSSPSFGVIRFAALEDEKNTPPIAVGDTVTVTRGRSVNIDVLGNDFDADGDVLVLTEAVVEDVTIPEVELVVVNGQYVRLLPGAVPQPTRPIPITYTVSDGVNGPVSAQVMVQVIEPEINRVPNATPDRAVVRAGDVVTIDVLRNDTDPENDPLAVTRAAIESSKIGGAVWVSGNTVRFLADADVEGRVYLSYTIDDSPIRDGLREQSAQIEIDVIGVSAGQTAPTAAQLEARVYAGGRATIVVPTINTDAEGDSVRLLGFGPIVDETAVATKGRVSIDDGHFVYEAWPGAQGTDSFTYQLVDSRGAVSAPALVRVTVVRSANHPPVAARDEMTVRPGRVLDLPVLANDTDPDGDLLQLAGDVEEQLGPDGTTVLNPRSESGRVALDVPREGTFVAQYRASDGRGGVARGAVIVHGDEHAPLLPPTPRDDIAEPDPQQPGMVIVKILENDDDPDMGRTVDPDTKRRSDIVVQELYPADAGEFDGDTLRVRQTDRDQYLLYTVVDQDGLTGSAVVFVPELGANRLPRLKQLVSPLTVIAGEKVTISLDGVAEDPDGDKIWLAGTRLAASAGVATYDPGRHSFTFTADAVAADAFSKNGKVSFEVTDDPNVNADEGTSPAAGRIVRLELAITIEFDGSLPITTNTIDVRVDRGGEVSVNLVESGAVINPNPGPAQFSVATRLGDVPVAIGELSPAGVFTATGLDDAPVGGVSEFTYTVSVGDQSAKGTVRVEVVRSTQPPPTAANFVFEVRNDAPHEQDLSEGAVNSFAADGEPLHLVSVEVPSQVDDEDGGPAVDEAARWGDLDFELGTGNTTVVFRPDGEFSGTLVVRYVIADAKDRELDLENGDASSDADLRRATGTITYNVIGRPLQPPPPTVLEVRSHTVVLDVGASDPEFWQGTKERSKYVITWPGGDPKIVDARQTIVTIEDLDNDVPVQFQVAAENKVGRGEFSLPSVQVRPDQVPDKPAPPRITLEDRDSLRVEWDPSIPDGSAVQGYQLYVSDSSRLLAEIPGNTTFAVVEGLLPGQNYSFALVARNEAETNGGRSERSDWSQPGHPYVEPEAPTGINVQDEPGSYGSAAVLDWSAPVFDGGDPIQRYIVLVDNVEFKGAGQITAGPVSIPGLSPGDHTYTVIAENQRGAGAPASARFFSEHPPSPLPAITSITPGDGRLTVHFQGSTWNNETHSGTYRYRVGTGAWQAVPGQASPFDVAGLTNCAAYDIQLMADDGRYQEIGSAVSGTPYSAPPTPAATASVNQGTITWSWSASASGACGASVNVTLDGSTISTSGSGSQAINYGANSGPHTLLVTVTDSRGAISQASTQASTGSLISVTISRGGFYTGGSPNEGDCTAGYNCKWVTITSSGWAPNQLLTVTCHSSYGTVGPVTRQADGSGNYPTWSKLCMFATVSNVYVVINDVQSNVISTWRDW